MLSDSCSDDRQNPPHNLFDGLLVGSGESQLVTDYFIANDFSPNTVEAITNDLRKFVRWFNEANNESFQFERVTTRDVVDFRNQLHRVKRQANATCNRALVVIRRLFAFFVERGIAKSNPAKQVKNLKRVELPPKGLERPVVRKLLRQIELCQDQRANAVFHMLLYTGARVSDLVNLELDAVFIAEKSGHAVFRHGKGNKERTVPLPNVCRKALSEYMDTRPPVESNRVFVGERGQLTIDGFQFLCQKYGAMIGERLHPHLFRHTFAKKFLADNDNDLAALALILGHSNIQTTARYAQKDQSSLAQASENVNY